MVIDWEHHYLPEELWLKKGGKKGERAIFYERGKPRGNLHPELCDVEEHLRVMDAVGIDVAVLSMAVSNDDTRIAVEECKIWDEEVGELDEEVSKKVCGFSAGSSFGRRGGV